MSMPTVPDIKPKIEIDFNEVVNLLLASIALEELSLAHIMNAEGEKIQEIVKEHSKNKLDDLIRIDEEVDKVLRDVIKKEMLLEFKFDNILELIEEHEKKHDHDHDHDDAK